jgi:hypothetical protein
MNETEKMVAKYLNGLGSKRYSEIFAILESHGLKPLGKSNTGTLLFQFKDESSGLLDIFAFRLSQPPVISFPQSYWLPRGSELSALLANFTYAERPPIKGHVSESQYSAGQVELSRSTHERVLEMCIEVCHRFS